MDENALSTDPTTARTSQNYVKHALGALMPVVLETLSKQDEDSADDPEHWDLGETARAPPVVSLHLPPSLPSFGRHVAHQMETRMGCLLAFVLCSVKVEEYYVLMLASSFPFVLQPRLEQRACGLSRSWWETMWWTSWCHSSTTTSAQTTGGAERLP